MSGNTRRVSIAVLLAVLTGAGLFGAFHQEAPPPPSLAKAVPDPASETAQITAEQDAENPLATVPLERVCRAGGGLEELAYKAWLTQHHGAAYQALDTLQTRKRYRLADDGRNMVVVAPPYDAYDIDTLKKLAGNGDAFAAGVLAIRYALGQVPRTGVADEPAWQQTQAERWIQQALDAGEPDLWMVWMLIRGGRRGLDLRDQIAEQRTRLTPEAFEAWQQSYRQQALLDGLADQQAIYRFMLHHGSLSERIEAQMVLSGFYDEKSVDTETRRKIENHYQQLRDRFPRFSSDHKREAGQREYEQLSNDIARLTAANTAIEQACRQRAESPSMKSAN